MKISDEDDQEEEEDNDNEDDEMSEEKPETAEETDTLAKQKGLSDLDVSLKIEKKIEKNITNLPLVWAIEVTHNHTFLYAHLKNKMYHVNSHGGLTGEQPDVSALKVKRFSSHPNKTWSQCLKA